MKKLSIGLSYMFICLCLLLCSCSKTVVNTDVWENATYTENTELGKGQKTIYVDVETEEHTVTFTVRTDKKTLGDALVENKLVQGEKGPYGLYVKVVNGITADYDVNQSYWSLCKNGEAVQSGVDGVEISDGEHYELVYTKN